MCNEQRLRWELNTLTEHVNPEQLLPELHRIAGIDKSAISAHFDTFAQI